MFRQLPTLRYSGLTIILSNPSRFDFQNKKILSSNAGSMMNIHCLRPELNVGMCDVRIADDTSPWIQGTRCILLCGEYALHKYIPESRANVLNELRGSPFYIDGIPTIASFFPQDCVDFKDHEREHNPEAKHYEDSEESAGVENKEDEGDVKRFSHTKRSNYAFWLKADVRKCKTLLQSNTNTWPIEQEPTYRIYPPADELIHILTTTKGQFMDYDKETDIAEQNWLCSSFTFDGKTVYCFPVLDNNYKPAYSSIHHILRALSVGIRDNILVAHNGAGFDYFVLGYKYHIPVVKCFDTMMAQHRCFPDIEKSLGHCTSLWTYQTFHKDENPHAYFTRDDMTRMMRYCGKDVFTMRLVRERIMEYSKTIPGLEDSINCAMRSIRPYLTMSLQGIRYDETRRAKKVSENDRLMTQYLRMITLLVGEKNLETIKKNATKTKSKGILPTSNPQACYYFHEMLGYQVVKRGKPHHKTGTRKPSLAKKAMLTLRLKYENPVIDLINLYRYTKLECTTPLGFQPFKDNDNKVIRPTNQTESSSAFQASGIVTT